MKYVHRRNMLIILCIGLLLFKLYSMKEMNFSEIIKMSSDSKEYESLIILQRDGKLYSKRTDRTDIMEDFFKHMEEYSFRRSFKRGGFRAGPQTYSIQLLPKIEKNNYISIHILNEEYIQVMMRDMNENFEVANGKIDIAFIEQLYNSTINE